MASKKDLLNTAKIRSSEERVAPTVKQDANVNPREDKGSLLWVDPKEIKENPFQPRTIFDENKHTEMVHSVKT